jgi:hypothetical protein
MWLDLQLATIGENFTHTESICGVNVAIRKGGKRLEIWVKDCKDEQINRQIGCELRDLLNLGNAKISFKSHKEEMAISYDI